MIDRRMLFSASAAVASFAATALTGRSASAKSNSFKDIEPRGSDRKFERLPSVDVESEMDFHSGFLSWLTKDFDRESTKRLDTILEDNGINPKEDVPVEEFIDLVKSDPLIATRMRVWVSNQRMAWKVLQKVFHGNAEQYYEEMESAENAGPGSLELNPDMVIPEYTKHEIHIQPGGYVGDPFGGYVNYYYGNMFYQALFSKNSQDDLQVSMSSKVPLPEDGRVLRILDMGCATGRLTFGIKERFPEAEVWGIDVGGPMVRFAHTRAVDLGLEVHFAQRLAEDTRFPDNHFDLVISNILHHEVSAQATDEIVAEAYRVLRPGGVFFPIDHRTGKQAPKKSASWNFRVWNDRNINNEVWRRDFESRDFAELIGHAGFDVDETVQAASFGTGAIKATKPA